MSIHAVSFFIAFVAAFFATPASIALARRWGVLDAPSDRKVHAVPMPRWGGMALWIAVIIAVGGVWVCFPGFRRDFWMLRFPTLLCVATVAWGIGSWDDRYGMSVRTKVFAQFILALGAALAGVRVGGVSVPGLGSFIFPAWGAVLFATAWLMMFMNVVNLADGLDGLAAGVAAIAATTFVILCSIQSLSWWGDPAGYPRAAGVLSAAVAGSCVGFLFHNFPPAKTFMGDGGAFFLGVMMGGVSLLGTLKTSAILSVWVPLAVMAIPMTDTAFAVFRRWRSGRGLFQADRGHFHHRLLDAGWTPREVTLLVYVVTLLLSMGAIVVALSRGTA